MGWYVQFGEKVAHWHHSVNVHSRRRSRGHCRFSLLGGNEISKNSLEVKSVKTFITRMRGPLYNIFEYIKTMIIYLFTHKKKFKFRAFVLKF